MTTDAVLNVNAANLTAQLLTWTCIHVCIVCGNPNVMILSAAQQLGYDSNYSVLNLNVYQGLGDTTQTVQVSREAGSQFGLRSRYENKKCFDTVGVALFPQLVCAAFWSQLRHRRKAVTVPALLLPWCPSHNPFCLAQLVSPIFAFLNSWICNCGITIEST